MNYRSTTDRLVGQAVESVRVQSHEDWELLICDDCSTSPPLWERVPQLFQDPRIRMRRNAVRMGSLRNAIESCALASGEVLIQLDGDDAFCEDSSLAEILSAHESGADATYGSCRGSWRGQPHEFRAAEFTDLESLQAVAPRSFRKNLFDKAIRRWGVSAFCDKNGATWPDSDDIALFYPLLRLASNVIPIKRILATVRLDGNHDNPRSRDEIIARARALPADDYDWRSYTKEYQAQLAEMALLERLPLWIQDGAIPERMHPNWKALYRTVLELKPTSVFEIGCGNGMHLENLHRLMPDLYLQGCDPLESQIALAFATAEMSQSARDAIEVGTCRDCCPDFIELIYTHAVLTHLSADNAVRTLSEALWKLPKWILMVERRDNLWAGSWANLFERTKVARAFTVEERPCEIPDTVVWLLTRKSA